MHTNNLLGLLTAPTPVGSGDLLGCVLDIVNNVVQCLQYLICVVGIEFGNNCHQIIELHPATSGEIASYRLSVGEESRDAVHINHRVTFPTSNDKVSSFNLMPPSLHKGQEISPAPSLGTLAAKNVDIIPGNKTAGYLNQIIEQFEPLIYLSSFLAGWWWYGYRHDRKQPNV